LSQIAYLNGEFVPAEQCRLPVHDLGIVLSAAVTDFIRTFNGEPYRMQDHVRRLYRSCKYACIEPAISIEETMEVSRRLIAHNIALDPGSELGLIYYITAGENAIYAGSAGLSDELKPTVVQHTFPLPFHIWKHVFTDGLHCVTPYVTHVPPEMFSSKIKHRNRMHMWIGEQQARLADPKAIALFLDARGNITETGGSNFVIYRDGAVVSPKRANILWGVSLQVLSDIVREMGMGFVEDDIQVYDVVNADEAWVPTTPYCLGPVTKINGIPIGGGGPGPVWRRIIARWSEIVEKDVYAELAEAQPPKG
jgi:branched-chain amino acid aminotransferase